MKTGAMIVRVAAGVLLLSLTACEYSLDVDSATPKASPSPTPAASPPEYYVGEIMSPLKISKETWSLDLGEKILVQVTGYNPEEHGRLQFYRIAHPDEGEVVTPIEGAPAPNGQMYQASSVGSVKIEAEGRRCPPSGSAGRCSTTELGSLFIYVKDPNV